MEKLDKKIIKEMFCHSTRELLLFKKESSKGYYLESNEGYQLRDELNGMEFPSLKNFKEWLALFANQPEKILKQK